MKYIYLILLLAWGSFLTIDAQNMSYENLIQKLATDFETPGIAVGVLNSDVFIEYFNGYSNIESEKEIDRNTQFNVASISKLVTAIAIMHLVERGKIALEQPINNYLTRWKINSDKFNTDKVTVRRVLNHTAGLSREFGPGFNSRDSLVSLVHIFTGKSEKREPLRVVYDPGSSSLYSNMGYGLLQMLIEDVSGIPFNEYISKNIFGPLGISQSTFQDPLALNDKTNLATPYNHLLQPQEQERFVVTSAAGLLSNLKELEILMLEETKNQKLLSIQSYNKMFINDVNGYGLGHMNQQDDDKIVFTGHTGLGMGWNASFWFMPEASDGIIVLTNGDNGSYIHQTLTCYWYYSSTGKRIKSCNSPINKKLNRVSLFLEIITEMGHIDKSVYDSMENTIREMRNDLNDGDVGSFKDKWSSFKNEVNMQLENKEIPLDEVPPEIKDLFKNGGIKPELNKTFESIDFWIDKPWFNGATFGNKR